MSTALAADGSFLLDLYARFRRDPLSVPADWRVEFETGEAAPASADLLSRLREAYRLHGHRAAALDPLALAPRQEPPTLARLRVAAAAQPSLADGAEALQRAYAGTAAIEAMHLADEAQRDWLHDAWERAFAAAPDPALAARALEAVALADAFESFLAVKFPTKKRFGIEGAESAIVFLRELLRAACLDGVEETVVGGMHRGRLCTLATVFGKSPGVLLAEIKGRDLTAGGPDYTGDVPYHLGHDGTIEHGGRTMRLLLSPHPSHLLTVAPVVTGLARARRDAGIAAMALLLHTDAAFSGQGLTAELLQLGGLDGYRVGGTVHLVVNNRIGFTTLESEGRSAVHCTDIGKSVGVPILHVNGDDPVAVARIARLAFAWRQAHGRDVIVDLVCYRRNGHNELDEPRFTQPRVWAAVDRHPSLHASFGSVMAAADPAASTAAGAAAATFREALQRGYEGIDSLRPNTAPIRAPGWEAIARADAAAVLAPVETGLPLATLREIGRLGATIPPGVASHPKVEAFYRARRETIEAGEGLNFATAEALAFASLLAAGNSVRLSGQDCVRGTFTQRHLAVHDMETGASALPLAAVAASGARFEPINSPLAEYAVLGFEYGHSQGDPRALTVWEAQFGDFLNGAQIMVDQFIVSAEAKWETLSGLVMLLPHGLEGQGPDHSSARIERLLQLCAGGNMIVANPSTPANLFHLLRRQVVAAWRKPLFVIAPKSLLRQRACVSSLVEFGPGTGFRALIDDEDAPESPPAGRSTRAAGTKRRRLVMCSGKIAYELLQARAARRRDRDVAILRVEQLYPLPIDALAAAIAARPDAECVWCQEEPENQGAAAFVLEALRRHQATRLRAIGVVARPPLPVAAGGSIDRHEREQAELVARALGGG
ncbi:MAG: 2-oxoglutarate dehydrogenase E1 component [Alphaproteobacteria bacterium]|nr:2-oxoglutarate dehydrogenase E1 component [Alphaproteobacteria bacterium]